MIAAAPTSGRYPATLRGVSATTSCPVTVRTDIRRPTRRAKDVTTGLMRRTMRKVQAAVPTSMVILSMVATA
jgi:hypothetical protein